MFCRSFVQSLLHPRESASKCQYRSNTPLKLPKPDGALNWWCETVNLFTIEPIETILYSKMGVTNTSRNTHLCLHHSSSKKPIVPADTQRPQWSMKSRCWDPAMFLFFCCVGLVNAFCSSHFIETDPAVWFRMEPREYFLWYQNQAMRIRNPNPKVKNL